MRTRLATIALFVFVTSCVGSGSVTQTGTGLFAPKFKEEPEAPAGLDLSVVSVAPNGTAVLELRNYSIEPFVFYGAPDRPRLVIESESERGRSRHTFQSWARGQKTHELAPGERITVKTGGLFDTGGGGRVRVGIRHHTFGYVVWTPWIAQ